jgi:hypothetical protein
LVVKKGFQMRAWTSGVMPEASSAMVMETPGSPVRQAAAGHDVERIADEVGEDLADFSFEAMNFAAGAAAALDAYVRVVDAALIDGEHRIAEVADVHELRAGGLAVEAEGLRGDGGGAAQFDFGGGEVAAGFLEGVGDLGEIDEIGDGLERVVDLVGDGAGEAADDG